MAFDIVGPFAEALDGGGDNLVPRARDRLLARMGSVGKGFALTLDKQLHRLRPVWEAARPTPRRRSTWSPKL